VAFISELSVPLHGEDLRMCLLIPMKLLSSKDQQISVAAAAGLRQSFGGVFERLKVAACKNPNDGETEEFKLSCIDGQKLIHVCDRTPFVLSSSIFDAV